MRGGPGAKKTLLSVNSGISGGLFCDLFSLLSSLFSLQTRESANLVAVQSLLACFDCFCFDSRRPRGQQTLLSVNLGISGSLFCDLFSLLSSLFSLLSVVVVSRHLDPKSRVTYSTQSLLFCLCSLLSLLRSLVSRCCSFLRSHFAPVPSIFASGHGRRPQLLRPFAAPSLAQRNARSD